MAIKKGWREEGDIPPLAGAAAAYISKTPDDRTKIEVDPSVKGAGTGAAAGAVAGAFFGPVGAAVGAGIGGLIGGIFGPTD